MSVIRLSLSLPNDAHPDLKVSVEQPGAPDMVMTVPLSAPAGEPPVASVTPLRAVNEPRHSEQEDYELGGYAGI